MDARPTTPAKPRLAVHIRWMIRRDMAEVLEIERENFEYPWSEEDFIRVLRQSRSIAMVAECGEQVVGYIVYSLFNKRLDLLSIVVERDNHRHQIGRQLVEKLIGKLSNGRRIRIETVVRETNLPAQLFFKAMGFRATGVLPDHYEDSLGEAAYAMEYRL